MSLVKKDDMTKLLPASEAASVAATSVEEIQLAAIAYSINSAANTGERRVETTSVPCAAVIKQLKDNGYTVTEVGSAKQSDLIIIKW